MESAAFRRLYFQVKKQIQAAAKKGDVDVCKILAKSIIQSRQVRFFKLLILDYTRIF